MKYCFHRYSIAAALLLPLSASIIGRIVALDEGQTVQSIGTSADIPHFPVSIYCEQVIHCDCHYTNARISLVLSCRRLMGSPRQTGIGMVRSYPSDKLWPILAIVALIIRMSG
jgi:hypothetical protein